MTIQAGAVSYKQDLFSNPAALLATGQDTPDILARARAEATAQRLPYAGIISPEQAWGLVQAGRGVLVDVRSAEERKFVGHVSGSIHVPWATGLNLQRNPRFVRELEAKVKKDDVVLLLCRSGARSGEAAKAATEGRFRNVFSIADGFEGELDARQQRGYQGGWRFLGLPWVQD